MLSAKQARIRSENSRIIIEDEIYRALCCKFNGALRTACSLGERYVKYNVESYSEANNKRFVEELNNNGYTVEVNPLSYHISW